MGRRRLRAECFAGLAVRCSVTVIRKENAMGFFGRLMGIEDEQDRRRAGMESGFAPRMQPATGELSEAQALERYRYLLRTAPPETLEQAHAEAFGKLSQEQRRQVLTELAQAAPASERAVVARTPFEDPQALARVATRAEIRQPGVLERSLGNGNGGRVGLGTSLLSSLAMGFVGSMVAQSFFSALGGTSEGGEAEALASNEAPAEDEITYEDNGDFSDEDFDV
jgi:hypothetical protein